MSHMSTRQYSSKTRTARLPTVRFGGCGCVLTHLNIHPWLPFPRVLTPGTRPLGNHPAWYSSSQKEPGTRDTNSHPLVNRETASENIAFPQLRWRAVTIQWRIHIKTFFLKFHVVLGNYCQTRMHSSRMRTTRLRIIPAGEGGVLTRSRGGGGMLWPGPGVGRGGCCDQVQEEGGCDKVPGGEGEGGVVTRSGWGGDVVTRSRGEGDVVTRSWRVL